MIMVHSHCYRILILGTDCVMVSNECVKRSDRMPASTKLLICIPNESTYVGSDHRNSEQIKFEQVCDRCLQIFPGGEHVSGPVAAVSAKPGHRRSRDNERSFLHLDQRRSCGLHLEQIVNIVIFIVITCVLPEKIDPGLELYSANSLQKNDSNKFTCLAVMQEVF